MTQSFKATPLVDSGGEQDFARERYSTQQQSLLGLKVVLPTGSDDAGDEIDWTDLLSAPQKVREMVYDLMAASKPEYVNRDALVANVAQPSVERPSLKWRTPSLLTGTSRIYLTKSANARIRPRLLTPLEHLHVMGHPVYSDRWLLKAHQHCLTDFEKCHLAGNAFCVQLIGRVILWFLSCTGKCEE